MVISQKHKDNLFDASGLYFNGVELSVVDETTQMLAQHQNQMCRLLDW